MNLEKTMVVEAINEIKSDSQSMIIELQKERIARNISLKVHEFLIEGLEQFTPEIIENKSAIELFALLEELNELAEEEEKKGMAKVWDII